MTPEGSPCSSSLYYLCFDFEEHYDLQRILVWLEQKWYYSLCISLAYLIAIFGLQRVMDPYEAFKFRIPMAIYNSAMAVMSCWGACRAFAQLLTCLPLMDSTIQLVLLTPRHNGLHHSALLVIIWFACRAVPPYGIWLLVTNYHGQAWWYFYMSLRTYSIRPPRFVKLVVLQVELFQRLIGFSISCTLIYYIKYARLPCGQSDLVAFLMFSCHALFIYFGADTKMKFVNWRTETTEIKLVRMKAD